MISLTNDYVVRQVSAVLSFNRRIVPLLGLEPDEEAVANGMEPARVVMAELAGCWATNSSLRARPLARRPDGGAHLSFLLEYQEGRDLLAAHPNLSAWLDRIKSRPSMRATSWDALIERTGVDTKRPLATVA